MGRTAGSRRSMRACGVLGLVHVAAREGTQEALVIARCRRANVSVNGVDARRDLEMAQEILLEQRRGELAKGEVINLLMECPMGLPHARDPVSPRRDRLFKIEQTFMDNVPIAPRRAARDQPRGKDVESRTDLTELLHVLLGDLGDDEAAPRQAVSEPDGLEALQRLSHRRPADSQLLGELDLIQARPWLNRAIG